MQAVVEAVRIPVTVKMRLGWDDARITAPQFAKEFEQAGVAAIIQPGGSKKDDDVIAACNALGIPMVLTFRRHFKH